MIQHTLPTGTIITIKGLPFELAQDCNVLTNENNYKLFVSQSEHSVESPFQAASPDKCATNNASFESI